MPNETAATTATNSKKTGTAAATGTSKTASSTDSSETGPAAPISSFLSCSKPSGPPICSPNNNSIATVGDTYYGKLALLLTIVVFLFALGTLPDHPLGQPSANHTDLFLLAVTWDPSRFEVNTTIAIVLNYANDSSHRAAWTSEGVPKEKSFVTVTMDKVWLQEFSNNTLEFALVSYITASDHTNPPYEGPTIFLSEKAATHFKPPPHTKLPDKLSLLIGLPVGLGALLVVLFGLFYGMKKHRHIDVTKILSKRKGYGVGKSRRQRLGKKGAIRLEEREVLHTRAPRGDDEIMGVPPVRGHAREESLGSLVSDGGNGRQGNAFRDEIEKQRTGR